MLSEAAAQVFYTEIMANWFYAVVSLASTVLACGLGIHAFHRHRLESAAAASPRKWMFWLYSAVFLVAAALGLVHFCVTVVFRHSRHASFQMAYLIPLAALSYAAFIIGAKLWSSD